MDRFVGIISVLLVQNKVTALDLAEEFKVSRRTINRDIEDICNVGIPIAAVRGQNGGISIREGCCIDHALFYSSDMQAILAGLQSKDSAGGTNFYQRLMAKFNLAEIENRVQDPPAAVELSSSYHTSLMPRIELIQGAIENRERVAFTYFTSRGESRRIVEPYKLIFQKSSWYVWGYCVQRKDYRMFELNRMLDLVSTHVSYTLKRALEMPRDQARSFPYPIQVEIRFEQDCKWRILEEYGVGSFEELKDGRLLFQFSFLDKESLFSWLLSFGNRAELLKPTKLREEFVKVIQNISSTYKNTCDD